MGVIKDVFGRALKKKNRKVETSLIEEFQYPKLGSRQLWEVTAAEIEKWGADSSKRKSHSDAERRERDYCFFIL